MRCTVRPPATRYRTILMDTARWEHVPFRAGDIVISAPPKCGTTWTQMICALLIFQTPRFPRALDAVSLWPDALTHRLEEVLADLAAQPHRRFMKTHTPLDGLPFDDRVTYLTVARDPRDVAISWDNHIDNADLDVAMAMRAAAVGMDDLDPSAPTGIPERLESAHDRIWGPGRHLAGDNTFSYFLDPSGNTMEYTTELEQIDEDTWHPHLYDFTQPDVQDQWGTANSMNEFVAAKSFNDPDKGLFVAPPV